MINLLNTLLNRKTFETMTAAEQRTIWGHNPFGKLRFRFVPAGTYRKATYEICFSTISRDTIYQDVSVEEVNRAVAEKRQVKYCR